MDLHRKLSESSDDSNASDHSMDRPLSFKCDEEKPEEIIQRNRESFDELKRSTEELKSEYDRNHPTLISKIKELEDISDEIESVHKNTRVGSLVGSSIGAVGGVTSLVGLALSPFTFGVSLALTVGGAVAGAAGGATVAASNLTDMFKQKNLKQTIAKIISDFLEIIKPMAEYLRTISYIAADIQKMNEILSKVEFQIPVRGFDDLFKIASVADVALIGKLCAEAAKEIRVYLKAVNAIHGPAQAARAMRGPAQAVNAIPGLALAARAIRGLAQTVNAIPGPAQAVNAIPGPAQAVNAIPGPAQAVNAIPGPAQAVNAIPGPAQAVNAIPGPAQAVNSIPGPAQAVNAIPGPAQSAIAIRETADKIRMSAAAGGALSVQFPAHDVASIVEDSKELYEMNQPAKERKAEEIKSEILKFIHQMRNLASQFQETLDKIKRVINTFNKMLQNNTPLRLRHIDQ